MKTATLIVPPRLLSGITGCQWVAVAQLTVAAIMNDGTSIVVNRSKAFENYETLGFVELVNKIKKAKAFE